MATAPAVRIYFQLTDDAREKAKGRFYRFEAFDETDAGRTAARAGRYLPTPKTLPRLDFERNRERFIQEAKRTAGLDRKEHELQVDAWTKEAAALVRARNHRQAIELLKKGLVLVPSHAGAKQGLAEAERMMVAPTVPSTDEFQLFAQIRSLSYHAKVNGKPVSRSGSVLADYVFCAKGHTHSGYQSVGRVYTKTEILRDHAKIIASVLRDKNLVVSRLTRGSAKACFWTTKGEPSGWQVEDSCVYRDVKEPRTLLVKEKLPLQG
jgi:hypothetical protein